MQRMKCPTCGTSVARPEPGTTTAFPFCSPRCRTIDLGKWIDERYRIEAEPVPEESLQSEN
jgi:hypothetical protein